VKRRRRRDRDPQGAFALARKLVLAPITNASWDGGGWLVEPAWDGHRVLATRVGDDVRLAALDFKDWTATFPGVTRALRKVAATSLAIDGVVCALDDRGAPSFDKLREQVSRGIAVTDAVLICWDVMWLDDVDLRALPLSERRTRLAPLLVPPLIPSQQLDGELARVLDAAGALGLRGVVARRPDAGYDGEWHARSTTAAAVDFRRSLSPPPPLTNADKVLYPRDGICKRDIVGYYRDVAPVLVPQLVDRPVVVQRWPDGIDEFDWYQHRVPPRAPDYIRAAWVDGVRRIVIENGDALLWLVNQAGLTYHGFASRLASLTEPDFAVIDLDPGDRTTWRDIVEVALAVRKLLELLELPSVIKTSGQRGVHILVPLGAGHTFEQVERLGDGVAKLLLRLLPDLCTLEYEKEKRGGRLLVDTRQHLAKTLVVAYSLRAADGATVSTPLAWDELTPALDPRAFTLRTVRERLDRRGDLAAPLYAGTTRLDRALAQLAAQRV
jgi:bifunctional non-homologous end joining protein LigD